MVQPFFVRRKMFFAKVCLPAILLLMPFKILATNQTPLTPLSYFEIFYQNLLEFSTSPTMNINGFVHCNTNIYVGSSATLTFLKTVSAAGSILAPPNNGLSWGDPTNYSSSWNTLFNGNPASATHAAVLETSLGAADPRVLIELPPPDEDPGAFPGFARLYNQAQIVLTVTNLGTSISNFTVSLKVQRSPGDGQVPGLDPAPMVIIYTNATLGILASNLPFLSLTNRFFDRREFATNLATQIDVGLYKRWLTNAASPVREKFFAVSGDTNFPTILYVADNRKTGPYQLAVVRLTNGISPPVNGGLGFSVATPNPLFVWGSYNCTNPAFLGTTNTATASATFCAFFCDAFTILSTNWSDRNSLTTTYSQGSSSWAASPTTVNAVVLSGIVPSTGSDSSHFSGGVHNFPRLLENWSGRVLVLNTALISLYNSARATNFFGNPGLYYSPPTRLYAHDSRYEDPEKAPPGMPTVLTATPLIYTSPQTVIEPFGSNDLLLAVSAASYGQLAYQWAVNGTNIDGATNKSLALSNLRASESSAIYTVTVSDATSTNTATILNLIVSNAPPLLTQQPVNLAILAGSNAMFSAAAAGKLPMSWQWQFNQTNIDGATNSTLALTNVIMDQAGDYSVLVANGNGLTTSSNASLSVYLSPAPAMATPTFSANNQMQFTLVGVPGLNYAVQVSTDLLNWDFVATNISPFDFTDTNAANFPQRYYRAIYMP